MAFSILTLQIRSETDVVFSRQRARQIARLLGFPARDEVRIATAVSELTRNTVQYAGKGKVEFLLDLSKSPCFQVRISDHGPGIANVQQILDGHYKSSTGLGMGILGARRLMDDFEIRSARGEGTTILTSKLLPGKAPRVDSAFLAGLSEQLAREAPADPVSELQRQNQELLATLEELYRQQAELAQINNELEDTNRGVVALYAELDERADFLRRAAQLKSQFLSNMTHEFRTPLNSILSLSRILLDRLDGPLTSEQEKQVRFIERAAEDLSELVNDLLDLAKVEAGKITIRPTEFQIVDLFSALRGMLRPLLAHNSSVSLNFDEVSDLPPLRTDESKVSQILRNFISNALKYTESGEVRVTASRAGPDRARICVHDTGIGIASEYHSEIFEEFTQVEGPHQKGKIGTGLGLPLSKRLAELLGGSISLQSKMGEGSTFCLEIPCHYAGATEIEQTIPLPPLDPNLLPVLFLDDNTETLFVYEKYLQGTEFQPVCAKTVREGREILKRFRPVGIVLDILLSHESTWSFLDDLKRDPETASVPVWVVSMVQNETKAKRLGAAGFFPKPLDRQWLLSELKKAAAEKKAMGELLIIDDEESARYVLKGFLSHLPHLILEAETGTQALRLLRERRIAAVFLDLVLPDMSGFELLEKMQADPATSAIPVIVHTGKILSRQEQQRLDGRTVAILSKDHSDRADSWAQIREALVKAKCL